MNEKSSQDEIDVIAQANAAVQHLVEKLKPTPTCTEHARTECMEVKTGNQMIDQFVPWYFGIAFAFIFTYNAGMPDMPAFARRPRHRRDVDAPRIETDAWVQAMSRRVESSVSRDWSFGFVTWNN